MAQYNHAGKKGAYTSSLSEYEAIVAAGRKLGPQTGVPFGQLELA